MNAALHREGMHNALAATHTLHQNVLCLLQTQDDMPLSHGDTLLDNYNLTLDRDDRLLDNDDTQTLNGNYRHVSDLALEAEKVRAV